MANNKDTPIGDVNLYLECDDDNRLMVFVCAECFEANNDTYPDCELRELLFTLIADSSLGSEIEGPTARALKTLMTEVLNKLSEFSELPDEATRFTT